MLLALQQAITEQYYAGLFQACSGINLWVYCSDQLPRDWLFELARYEAGNNPGDLCAILCGTVVLSDEMKRISHASEGRDLAATGTASDVSDLIEAAGLIHQAGLGMIDATLGGAVP